MSDAIGIEVVYSRRNCTSWDRTFQNLEKMIHGPSYFLLPFGHLSLKSVLTRDGAYPIARATYTVADAAESESSIIEIDVNT